MNNPKEYAICQLAICPVRSDAKDEAEIVTQLVFGDYVSVLSDAKPWIKVKNHSDGYEGWMDFKQVKYITASEFDSGTSTEHIVVGNPQLQLRGPYGSLTVFNGASLPYFDGETCRIGDDVYTLLSPPLQAKSSDITNLCQAYLNAPYLWGGKSLFGIDCSGLTQNIFKSIGKQIPRNASDQVHIGKDIPWEKRKPNDVVFFTTSSPKVTHVGILLKANEIIHAHGRVRIDQCDEKGIYNAEQGKYTHHFHSIKRWC